MPESVVIPTRRSPDLVTFTVLAGGATLPQEVQLLEAVVTSGANRITGARLSFRDGDTAKQNFEWSESGLLDPGTEIEFKAGYQRDETTLFKGIIVAQRIQAQPGRPARLIVECRHRATLATLARRSRQFSDQDDADTISTLLGEYDLAGDIIATTPVHPQLVQWNATDWDFVLLRARANGLLVVPTLDRIDLRAPDFAAEPALALAYGTTIAAFDLEIDARHQPALARVQAWSSADQEQRVSETSSAPEPSGGVLTGADLASAVGDPERVLGHAGDAADDELAAWAGSSLLRARLAKIRGTLRCRGTADVSTGSIVKLEGLGDRFNGPAFVAAVRHQISQGDWRTEIQIGLDPAWFSFDDDSAIATAAGLLPRPSGLHVGIVKQLAADPAGNDRILVDLPVALPGGPGLWARLATPEAGENRGFVFRPEIGDEVIVGFFGSDPRHPVVLGALHSAAHPSPIAADDANPKKGYTGRSAVQLLFDEGKKIITLSTPAGNKLVLSDEDQGITLEDQSGNKLVMRPDAVALEGVAKIKQSSGTDFAIEAGTNLKASAAAQLTVEGAASAAVKSSGQLELRGALVRIN